MAQWVPNWVPDVLAPVGTVIGLLILGAGIALTVAGVRRARRRR